MKKSIALVLLSFIFAAISFGAVTDAPHNESQAISCRNCHSYSLWWQYSPSTGGPGGHGALSNAVCLSCHGPGKSQIQKDAHSSDTMGTTIPGEWEWTTNCADCHDPHFQRQIDWLEDDPELAADLYLVTGTIGAETTFSSADNGDGTINTSFAYLDANATPAWSAPSSWPVKTGAGRGLIMVLTSESTEGTFEIVAAAEQSSDNGTVTVLGFIDTSFAGSRFGLIYGQLLKKEINQKPVKFFDPNSDFIDASGATEGLCQVCHTKTAYYNSVSGNGSHYTTNCSGCHDPNQGFEPIIDHSTRVAGVLFCQGCHIGDPVSLHNVEDLDGNTTIDCSICHNLTDKYNLVARLQTDLVDNLAWDEESQKNKLTTLPVNCGECHGPEGHDTDIAHNHRQTVALCATCHAVGSQSAIDTLHKGCETCHLYTGNKLVASEVAAAVNTGKGPTGSNVDCRSCHTVSAGNKHHNNIKAANNECVSCHTAVDHSLMVIDSPVPVCVGCHTETAGLPAGIAIDPADPKLHNSCRTCHTFDSENNGILVDFTNRKGVDGTGKLPDGGTIGGTDGGGFCVVCHTGEAQPLHHARPQVAVGQCEHCHVDPRIDGTHQPGDNGSDSLYPTQLACVRCHARFVDGDMVINKYTRTDYNDLSTPWEITIQHTIPGVSQGQINNYGICFSCHGAGTATKVRVFHARPDQHDSGNAWGLGTKNWRRRALPLGLGQADYAAGRGSSGIGTLNYFSASYENMRPTGVVEDRPPNIGDFLNDWYEHYTSPRVHLYPYRSGWTDPYIRAIPSSPLNAYSAGVVPLLKAVTPQVVISPAADTVKVEHAVFDGTDLIVVATNTDDCDSLTASYGSSAITMSGTFNCTAIFVGANYPGDGLTVDVTTANENGINVNDYPIADQPGAVAVNDSYSAYSNLAETLAVLSNDIGGGLVLQSVGAAGHGEVVISGENIIYTSDAGFAGVDSFSYVVEGSDNITSEATVEVTVIINQPPVAGADAYTLAAGDGQAVFNVLDNDTDGEGETLTVLEISQPSAGTAMLSGNSILYTPPAPVYDGDITITYQVSDGMANTTTGVVTVTVATPRDWVTVLDPWQPIPQQVPYEHYWDNIDQYHHHTSFPDFTVSPGLNRLLVISINVYANYDATAGKELVSATYGGKTLTKAYSIESTKFLNPAFDNYVSYFGYLTEADIASMTGNELDIAYPTSFSGITISIASYSNVNQTTPIVASSGNRYTIQSPYEVIEPAVAPIAVQAGQYALYNKAAEYCDANATNDEGYIENIDYVDDIPNSYMYKVGLASKLILADGSTNPTVTDGECTGNGASAFIVLNNVSGISATVDTDMDGVGELADLCPDTVLGQSVTTYGCASSQTPEPSVISFSSANFSADENKGLARITVRRTASIEAVSINYATTAAGTATPVVDYQATSGTISWAAGDATDKTITIYLNHNQEYNPIDKTVGIELSSPVGVTATLGSQNTAMLTIVNTDPEPAIISFKEGAASNVAENAGMATVTVSRTGSSIGAVDVAYATYDGTANFDEEYLSASGTLHWDDNDTDDKIINVTILDNSTYWMNDFYFTVRLTSPSSGSVLGSYDGWEPWTVLAHTVTIVDNELPAIVNFSSATYSVNEDDPNGVATITVQRSGDSSNAVTVGGQTDISQLEPEYLWFTLNWLAGDMEDKTFEVPIVNDSLHGPDKTIPMTIYYGSNAELGSPITATLTIVNDDPVPPNAVFLSASSYSVNENSGTATITVSRSGDATGAVGVSYATTNSGTATSGDYTATSGTLSWADGDMADKTFEIPIVDNSDYSGDKTVSLELSSPTGGTLILGSPNTAMLNIVNDDAGLTFSSATYSVMENGGTATVTVSRLGSSVGAVGVSYATTDGTATPAVDYNPTSGTLSWADGDMADKSFTISIINNAILTEDRAVNLVLSAPTGSAAVLGDINTSALTIADDDMLFVLDASSYSVNEGDGAVDITVSRIGNSTGIIHILFWTMQSGTATYQVDYGDPVPFRLIWADGDMADKTVTIPIIDDSDPGEGNETAEFEISIGSNYPNVSLGTPSSAILTIIDND